MSELHICDVCRLLDKDTSFKVCGYCGLCDAWICEKDLHAWGRRLLAAVERKLEWNYAGMPNYVEVARDQMIEELKKQNAELQQRTS